MDKALRGFDRTRLGWLAVALLALAALVWSFARSEAKPGRTPLRIAAVSFFSQGKPQLPGLEYAVDRDPVLRDALAAKGYALEWFPAPHAAVGPLINEGFANKSIEFAGYGELPAIILNGSTPEVRTQLLMPEGAGDAYLVVPPGSRARSLRDLKGKRLAIHKGRPWEIPLLHLMEREGLSYADFKVYNINPEAGTAALAAGAIDGMVMTSAYALVDKGVARIIWSTKDAPLSWKTMMGFWGRRDFVAAHPDIAQLVIDAYVRAAHHWSDDANKAAFIALGTRNGTPESVVRRTYEDPHLSWKDRWSPLFSPAVHDHFRDSAAFAAKNGIIRNRIDIDRLIEPRFVEHALKTAALEGYWRGGRLDRRQLAEADAATADHRGE